MLYDPEAAEHTLCELGIAGRFPLHGAYLQLAFTAEGQRGKYAVCTVQHMRIYAP